MFNPLNRALRQVLMNMGIYFNRSQGVRGLNLTQDLQYLIKEKDPVIFDIGCNRGQSSEFFFKTFPGANIHAFEPSRELYDLLTEMKFRSSNIKLNFIFLESILQVF